MKHLKVFFLGTFLLVAALGISSFDSFSSGLCSTCTDGPDPNTGTCQGPRYARYCAGSDFTCDGTSFYSCDDDEY